MDGKTTTLTTTTTSTVRNSRALKHYSHEEDYENQTAKYMTLKKKKKQQPSISKTQPNLWGRGQNQKSGRHYGGVEGKEYDAPQMNSGGMKQTKLS